MPFTDPASTEAVVVITGGSVGAGREITRELARRGDTIVLVYLRNQAEAAVEELLLANDTAVAVRADLADELDVEHLFTEATAVFGGVDVVVHTQARGAAVVNRHAARRVRRAGVIIQAARTPPRPSSQTSCAHAPSPTAGSRSASSLRAPATTWPASSHSWSGGGARPR
jgi:3-oxoacyl-[acyl-carrier protein] reductase